MKAKLFAALALAILAALAVTVPAFAGGTIDAIIQDAADGTIDGNWTADQIAAALAYIQNNPTYLQYSDVEPVLEDYLASLSSPGVQGEGAGLRFTGGPLILLLAAGAGLMGGGLALRRRA